MFASIDAFFGHYYSLNSIWNVSQSGQIAAYVILKKTGEFRTHSSNTYNLRIIIKISEKMLEEIFFIISKKLVIFVEQKF